MLSTLAISACDRAWRECISTMARSFASSPDLGFMTDGDTGNERFLSVVPPYMKNRQYNPTVTDYQQRGARVIMGGVETHTAGD